MRCVADKGNKRNSGSLQFTQQTSLLFWCLSASVVEIISVRKISLRTFNNNLSASRVVNHGIPQGSVLGPLLFSLYLALFGQILRSFKVTFHRYADDRQLYMPVIFKHKTKINTFEACLVAVRRWLSAKFLLLNPAKTELLVIGPP